MTKRVYIAKTNQGSQGSGIKLLYSYKDLTISKNVARSDDQVVQRYVNDPLLIDNKKHDLRLYVTITSVDPLVAYINEEGLARFCVLDYESTSESNKDEVGMHLTNYSMNKGFEEYVYTNQVEGIHTGTKRTLKSYWASVEREGHNVLQVRQI